MVVYFKPNGNRIHENEACPKISGYTNSSSLRNALGSDTRARVPCSVCTSDELMREISKISDEEY